MSNSNNNNNLNWRNVLGNCASAKKRYHKLSLKFHPDKQELRKKLELDTVNDVTEFRRLQKMWETAQANCVSGRNTGQRKRRKRRNRSPPRRQNSRNSGSRSSQSSSRSSANSSRSSQSSSRSSANSSRSSQSSSRSSASHYNAYNSHNSHNSHNWAGFWERSGGFPSPDNQAKNRARWSAFWSRPAQNMNWQPTTPPPPKRAPSPPPKPKPVPVHQKVSPHAVPISQLPPVYFGRGLLGRGRQKPLSSWSHTADPYY